MNAACTVVNGALRSKPSAVAPEVLFIRLHSLIVCGSGCTAEAVRRWDLVGMLVK